MRVDFDEARKGTVYFEGMNGPDFVHGLVIPYTKEGYVVIRTLVGQYRFVPIARVLLIEIRESDMDTQLATEGDGEHNV